MARRVQHVEHNNVATGCVRLVLGTLFQALGQWGDRKSGRAKET